MLRFILTLALLTIATKISYGQNKGSIKGTVQAAINKQPLEKATVSITNVRDSALLTYTLSLEDGNFSLFRLPLNQSLKLLITYVGYTPYRKIFTLSNETQLNLGHIQLEQQMLDEVTINAPPDPIRIHKDTIEFSAEAFKTRPNAVVEDLLKKLPGVQVDLDGSVSVGGKAINKILVDGKEFFSNDIRVVTKNLDASLVASVQVMDDRGKNPDQIMDDSNLPKIMNLKLKKAIKKSTFGKVYAGGGTGEHFESGALINAFRDTLQFSIIAFGNNVNRAAFDYNELTNQGGFNRGEASIYGMGFNFGGQSYGQLQRILSSGININNNWGKKLKVNLIYFYGNNKNTGQNTAHTQQLLENNTIVSESENNNRSTSNSHYIRSLIEWDIDTMQNIRYEPSIRIENGNNQYDYFSQSGNENTPIINRSNGLTTNRNNRTNFSHHVNYFRRLKKKGQSISIRHNLQTNPNHYDNYQHSDIIVTDEAAHNTFIRQATLQANKQFSTDLSATYQYPLAKKLRAEIEIATVYEKNGNADARFDLNPETQLYDIFLDSLSTDLNRNMFTHRIRPSINWNLKQYHFNLSLTGTWQRVSDELGKDLDKLFREDFYLLPTVSLSKSGNNSNLNLRYNLDVEQPYLSQMQPIVNRTNPLYIYSGNPYLKPSKTHRINAYLYKYFTDQRININVNYGLNYTQNGTAQQRTVNAADGAQTSKPINVDGNYYSYAYVSFSKSFNRKKDWQLSLHSNVQTNTNRNYFVLNNIQSEQKSYSLNYTQRASFGWKELFEISPSYRISWNKSSAQQNTQRNNEYFRHELSADLTARWPKKILWTGSYAYRYNGQLNNSFSKTTNLVNATVSYMMMKKDQGEIRLAVFDLLNQNNGVASYTYNNYITDQNNIVLKQYFMLSYIYKFNKTVTKK